MGKGRKMLCLDYSPELLINSKYRAMLKDSFLKGVFRLASYYLTSFQLFERKLVLLAVEFFTSQILRHEGLFRGPRLYKKIPSDTKFDCL